MATADWTRYFKRYAQEVFAGFLSLGHWNYKDDITVVGLHDLYRATGEEIYRGAIVDAAGALIAPDGSVPTFRAGEYNLDIISCGKSLLILHELTGDAAYLQRAFEVYAHLDRYPRVSTGNYWHKDIYPNQVWLDGLYMALPFAARCEQLLGTQRYEPIVDQFKQVRAHLWVEARRLYAHAWDESREAEWANSVTGLSPSFWLRAEGWYLMALADCYEIMKGDPCAETLCTLLAEAVDGLMPYIDRESGMFLQLIDRSDLPDNYAETSGSAMAAYALMKGARLGMLGEELAKAGEQILESIREKYLSEEDGVAVLRGICASAGLGPGPAHRTDRDGSPAYYLSERQIADNQHGAAACMMAYAELALRRAR